MESFIISFLATGSIYGVTSIKTLASTFNLDMSFACMMAIAMSCLVSQHSSAMSTTHSPRLVSLIGCTLQVFGWNFVGRGFLLFGMVMVGSGCGLVREALVPTLHDRSKGSGGMDVKLVFVILHVAEQISAVIPHWINQARFSFFEPCSVSWSYACMLLMAPPFFAGVIAFARLPIVPVEVSSGKEASGLFGRIGAEEDVDQQCIWLGIFMHAFGSVRVAHYLSQVQQVSLGSFLGKPGDAEEFSEIVWKTLCIGGLVCYPVMWILLDLLGGSGMLLICGTLYVIWSNLVETGSFPNAAFALLFSLPLRSGLQLTIMGLTEEYSGNCQLVERYYTYVYSISGIIQCVLLVSSLWTRPSTFTYLINCGLLGTLLTAIGYSQRPRLGRQK